MAKYAKLPDGTYVSFPDDASDADIDEAINGTQQNTRPQLPGIPTDEPAQGPKYEEAHPYKARAQKALLNLILGSIHPTQAASEAVMHLGSSTVAPIVGGLAGLGAGATNLVAKTVGMKDDELLSPADTVRAISSGLTYEPRNPATKELVAGVDGLMGLADKGADYLATKLGGEKNPGLETAIKTTILGAPTILGLRKGIVNKVKISKAINSIETELEKEGINLRSADLEGEFAKAATRRVADARGVNIEQLQNQLIAKQKAMKDAADAKWTTFRDLPAGLRADTKGEVINDYARTMIGTDIENMPLVQRYLKKIDGLSEDMEGSFMELRSTDPKTMGQKIKVGEKAISLEQIDNLRKEITNARPSKKVDEGQRRALGILAGKLDKWADKQFQQDMIIGDPAAVDAWRQARKATSEWKRRFTANKAIRDLTEADATPEMYRKWIFGTSKAGAKVESGLVVRKLNDIFGKDSPEMSGVRSEYLYEIVRPLMDESPNIAGFLEKYQESVRNNPTLMNELAPYSKTGMESLYKAAQAIANAKGPKNPQLYINLEQAAARTLFGHAIAKSAMKVSIATQLFKVLRGRPLSTRKQILGEMLGYNPKTPVIPKGSAAQQAVITGALTDSMNQAYFDEKDKDAID